MALEAPQSVEMEIQEGSHKEETMVSYAEFLLNTYVHLVQLPDIYELRAPLPSLGPEPASLSQVETALKECKDPNVVKVIEKQLQEIPQFIIFKRANEADLVRAQRKTLKLPSAANLFRFTRSGLENPDRPLFWEPNPDRKMMSLPLTPLEGFYLRNPGNGPAEDLCYLAPFGSRLEDHMLFPFFRANAIAGEDFVLPTALKFLVGDVYDELREDMIKEGHAILTGWTLTFEATQEVAHSRLEGLRRLVQRDRKESKDRVRPGFIRELLEAESGAEHPYVRDAFWAQSRLGRTNNTGQIAVSPSLVRLAFTWAMHERGRKFIELFRSVDDYDLQRREKALLAKLRKNPLIVIAPLILFRETLQFILLHEMAHIILGGGAALSQDESECDKLAVETIKKRQAINSIAFFDWLVVESLKAATRPDGIQFWRGMEQPEDMISFVLRLHWIKAKVREKTGP